MIDLFFYVWFYIEINLPLPPAKAMSLFAGESGKEGGFSLLVGLSVVLIEATARFHAQPVFCDHSAEQRTG